MLVLLVISWSPRRLVNPGVIDLPSVGQVLAAAGRAARSHRARRPVAEAGERDKGRATSARCRAHSWWPRCRSGRKKARE